jgi:hypothetical protein
MVSEVTRKAHYCDSLRKLKVVGRKGNDISLTALEILPRILREQITYLDLTNFKVDLECAPILATFFESITDFRFKFEWIAPPANDPVGHFHSKQIFYKALQELAPSFSGLRYLELDGFYLELEILTAMPALLHLQSLTLRESKDTSEEHRELAISDFVEAPNLRSLKIYVFCVSASELRDILEKYPKLEYLEIQDFRETPYDSTEERVQLLQDFKKHKHLMIAKVNLGECNIEKNIHCLENRLDHSFEDFWKAPAKLKLVPSIIECSDRMAGPTGIYWLLNKKIHSDLWS